jgi:hypothetical protein
MSEKHKFTSPSAIQVKNRRKTASIKEKLDVISRHVIGERIVDIWLNVFDSLVVLQFVIMLIDHDWSFPCMLFLHLCVTIVYLVIVATSVFRYILVIPVYEPRCHRHYVGGVSPPPHNGMLYS